MSGITGSTPPVGQLNGALIDASSYASTLLEPIYEDANLYANPANILFNQAIDTYQIGLNIGVVPSILTLSPAGQLQSANQAVDGVPSGYANVMAMAARPNSAAILVAPLDDSMSYAANVAPYDVNNGMVVPTAIFNFADHTNLIYLGTTKNKFMATYPGPFSGMYPLTAQILTVGGTKDGAEIEIAPDLVDSVGHDLFFHSGMNRVLFAFINADEDLVIKESTTSGATTNEIGTVSASATTYFAMPKLAGETVCNSTLVVYTRVESDDDFMTVSEDLDTHVFGAPSLATLTAEPNPLPFSGTGTVSVRANLGAFKIKSAKITKGAANYKIVSDKCSGKVVARDQVCGLTVEQIGAPVPGVLQVTTDAVTSLDITLYGNGVTLNQIAPSNGATDVDPAATSLVWSATGGSADRFKVSVCTDAAMTQCQVSSSVVGSRP